MATGKVVKYKSKLVALILCACGFVGIGGLHHFYTGRYTRGIVYLCTGGLFLFGTVYDLIMILRGQFSDAAGYPLRGFGAVSMPVRRGIEITPPMLDGYTLRYSYDDVEIAGTEYYDTHFVRAGDKIEFAADPLNEHDPFAVVAMVRGRKIGYIHRNRLQEMYHNFCQHGGEVRAVVSLITDEAMYMWMGYYEAAPVTP